MGHITQYKLVQKYYITYHMHALEVSLLFQILLYIIIVEFGPNMENVDVRAHSMMAV